MKIKELKNLISFMGKVSICVFTPTGGSIIYHNDKEFYFDQSIDDFELANELVRPIDFIEGGFANIWTK